MPYTMSTKQLSIVNQKPIALTYDSFPIYKVPGHIKYEETNHTSSVPSMASPMGNTNRIDIEPANDDFYVIEELYLDWLATNSSGTEAPTFLNVFSTIQEVVLKINGSIVDHLKGQNDIICAVSDYLHEHADYVTHALGRCRSENANTYNGETVAVSSTLQFSLPMTVLFPFLKGLAVGGKDSKVWKITFEVTFTSNTNTASSLTFSVKSNTTSNAYSTNLTYSNIQIRNCFYRPSSEVRDLVLQRVGARMYRIAHENVTQTVAWNTINTDYTRINLNTTFTKSIKNIRGMYVFIDVPAARTAFNDADSAELWSGAAYIGVKILHSGRVILDHSNAVNDLKKRRDYNRLVHKKMWGKELPLAVMTESDNLPRYYFLETFIDLTNVEVFDQHELAVSSLNNMENIEIQLYCASALGASVQLHTVLEYVEEIQHDGKGNYRQANL